MSETVFFGNGLLDTPKIRKFILRHNIGDVRRENDNRTPEQLRIDILIALLEKRNSGRRTSPKAQLREKKKRKTEKSSRRINRKRS